MVAGMLQKDSELRASLEETLALPWFSYHRDSNPETHENAASDWDE